MAHVDRYRSAEVMMRLSRILAGLVVIGGLAMTPKPSYADSIEFSSMGPHASVLVSGLVNGVVSAGQLNWTWVGEGPAGAAASFYSYCVDLLNYAQNSQVVTIGTPTDMTGSPYVEHAGEKAAWLFNTFAAPINATQSDVQAAALQVAIWEALYDTSANLATGNIRVLASSAVLSQANSYLSALYSSSYVGSTASILFTGNGQEQITHNVSEPSSLLLVGAGLILFARYQRRRVATAVIAN
jgi:hypothetical protein